jgi:hypothetical protein
VAPRDWRYQVSCFSDGGSNEGFGVGGMYGRRAWIVREASSLRTSGRTRTQNLVFFSSSSLFNKVEMLDYSMPNNSMVNKLYSVLIPNKEQREHRVAMLEYARLYPSKTFPSPGIQTGQVLRRWTRLRAMTKWLWRRIGFLKLIDLLTDDCTTVTRSGSLTSIDRTNGGLIIIIIG